MTPILVDHHVLCFLELTGLENTNNNVYFKEKKGKKKKKKKKNC
jgi:hypothetical protein